MTARGRLTLAKSLDSPDVPVAELITTTRRTETRAAMAVVAALRDRGRRVRDVAVVVRDLDTYEEPLSRAAIQYGVTPVFWTQLRVTRTRPFALLEAVCDVLDADAVDRETLFRPLEHRWAPPSGTTTAWPLEPRTIQTAKRTRSASSKSVDEWRDEFREGSAVDDRLLTYTEWLDDCPEPTPDAVASVLGDIVESYRELGLPVTKANDSPALLETETEARAIVRTETLVEQMRQKYADRLEEGTVDATWGEVGDLCRLVVTQRPGRREHSNARAVDVLEANDVWLLDVPIVVAVGLQDGEWPQSTDSVVPPEMQEAVLSGDGDVASLAPRTAWTDGRDRDQFGDTLAAARNGLVVTRHTESVDGDEKHRSPLLSPLAVETISDSTRRRLLSADRDLPAPIRAMLPDEAEGDEDG